jgi:hypothetical protein
MSAASTVLYTPFEGFEVNGKRVSAGHDGRSLTPSVPATISYLID